MTDYSHSLSEKPFACDVEGCSLKFTNEGHLEVHRNRHNMVLNLCLGPKGANTTDQTPTPTRFIRNCEEVGLFQDLQNVNPFEETFRKAAEAVKTGQIPEMGPSFLCAPPDDTLHTPNIFPQMTEVSLPCITPAPTTRPSDDEVASASEASKTSPTVITSLIESIKTPSDLGCVATLEESTNKGVDSEKIPCATEAAKTPIEPQDIEPGEITQLLKRKLRESIRVKSSGEQSAVKKVPIPKVAGKSSKAVSHKFATFTKNSLKPVTNSTPVRLKKSKNKVIFLQQETRGEYLARNRAAATRCREKKKMYMSYLEKLNRELTQTNQNLQLVNISLMEQLKQLKEELSRHSSCSVYDSNSQHLLDSITMAVEKPSEKHNAKQKRTKDKHVAKGSRVTPKEPQVALDREAVPGNNNDILDPGMMVETVLQQDLEPTAEVSPSPWILPKKEVVSDKETGQESDIIGPSLLQTVDITIEEFKSEMQWVNPEEAPDEEPVSANEYNNVDPLRIPDIMLKRKDVKSRMLSQPVVQQPIVRLPRFVMPKPLEPLGASGNECEVLNPDIQGVAEIVFEEHVDLTDVVPIDTIKPATIIAQFCNDENALSSASLWSAVHGMTGEEWSWIAAEHSYPYHKHFKFDFSRKFLHLNNRESCSADVGSSTMIFSEVRTLSADTVVLNTPTSPSLSLVKPFKKRKISTKQSVKS